MSRERCGEDTETAKECQVEAGYGMAGQRACANADTVKLSRNPSKLSFWKNLFKH